MVITKQTSPLRRWRFDRGLNQVQAARILRVSQTHYSKLERLESVPRRGLMSRIVKKTGLTAGDLIGMAS